MAELPLDVEERLARLEKLFNKLNTPPMDLLLQEGYLQIGNSSTPGAVRFDGKALQVATGTANTSAAAVFFVPELDANPLLNGPQTVISARHNAAGGSVTSFYTVKLNPTQIGSGANAFLGLTANGTNSIAQLVADFQDDGNGVYIKVIDDASDPRIMWSLDGGVTEFRLGGGGMKVSGSGYQVYPSAATGISPANAGSAWANGSWSEVVASTAQADYLMGVIFGWDDLTNTTEVEAEIDIGTGAASSETVVSTVPAIKQATSSNGSTEATASADQRVVYFPHPIAVATSTRIAVRVRTSSTALEPTKIKLVYVEQADLVSL